MPPPRTGGSPDPLDPFPPLLSRRRPTVTVPTYASILRPHVTATASSRVGGSETGVWGVEDVDPADSLDEIRSIPSDPVTAAPWRQQDREAGGDDRQGPRPIEAGLGGLPEPADRNPELAGSVIAPGSAHRPGSTSTTRLAPIFTLDELLGGASSSGAGSAATGATQPRDRATLSPSPRSDPPGARPSTNLRAGPAAASGSRLASEFEHARRTWQGGIEAASRLGYDPAATAGSSSSASRGVGSAALSARQIGTGSSSINESDPGAIPLRRRSRRVFPPGLGPSLGPVLGRDGTYGLGDDDVWSQLANQHEYEMDMDDEDQDEHDPEHDVDHLENALRQRDPSTGLPRRTTRPFYSQPNLTGDIDLDEWTSAFMPALRRGGNNRRRDSLQQRIDPDRIDDDGWGRRGEEVMPLLADLPQGMDPTNTDTMHATQPVIVRTSGNRRQRSLSEGSAPEKQRSLTIKRRRLPATQTNPPGRPEYLSLTSLRPGALLPDDFTRPHSLSFLHLSHSTTGRPIIKFCDGPRVTGKDEDASALRANRPIPVECGVHYYEVECINAGHKGYMSVGWMTKTTKLNRLVGWDKGAWGWHADDGMSFNQNGTGQQFAERWSTGDMVGCGIDFTTGRAFFTKNGRLMGHRFSDLGAGLYPAIGLNTRNEELCVNFSGPFRFDIAAYVREARDNIEVDIARQEITEVPVIAGPGSPSQQEARQDKDKDGDEDVTMKDETAATADATPPAVPDASLLQPAGPRTTAAFVLDYLRYHGHVTALDSTRSEMVRRKWLSDPRPSSDTEEEASNNLATINEIARRLANPKSAVPIDLIDSLLPATAPLHHRMSVYRLVHLARQAMEERDEEGEMSAIAYGRRLRQRAKEQPWAQAEVELLDEAVGTVALGLNEVERTKWTQRRDRDAELLNRQLRSMSDLPVHPRLVDALVQTRIDNDHLARNGHPAATFLDIRRALKLDPTSLPAASS